MSAIAYQNYNPDAGLPITVQDNIDKQSFSLFVEYINDETFQIKPDNILILLKCALVYDCNTLYDEIQKLVCQFQNIELAIDALILISQHHLISATVEAFIAINYIAFMQNPKFCSIPVDAMHRILTWYNVQVDFNTQQMLSIFMQMANIHGMAATPLFMLLDYSELTDNVVMTISSIKSLDFDVINPLIRDRVQKSIHEKKQIMSQLSSLESELERVQTVYSQTEQRNRVLTSKTADIEARRRSAYTELQEYEAKYTDYSNQLDSIRNNTKEYTEASSKGQIDIIDVNREIEEMDLNITALKKKINEAAQIKAQLAHQQQLLEKKITVEEKKPANNQNQPKQEIQQTEEQKDEIEIREIYVEPSLKRVNFNETEFQNAFANNQDIKCEISSSPSLDYALNTEGPLRMTEFQIMWRNVQAGNPRACADYGLHLIKTDPLSMDLGLNYIDIAVSHDDPYALYNLAALIISGKVDGSREEAANYISKAARLGEPNSVAIVKNLVKLID